MHIEAREHDLGLVDNSLALGDAERAGLSQELGQRDRGSYHRGLAWARRLPGCLSAIGRHMRCDALALSSGWLRGRLGSSVYSRHGRHLSRCDAVQAIGPPLCPVASAAWVHERTPRWPGQADCALIAKTHRWPAVRVRHSRVNALAFLFTKIAPTTSSPGPKPSPAWRSLAGHLLWGSPMKNNPPVIIPTPRSGHVVSVHLDLDAQARPRPACLMKAERITAHGSHDRNGRHSVSIKVSKALDLPGHFAPFLLEV